MHSDQAENRYITQFNNQLNQFLASSSNTEVNAWVKQLKSKYSNQLNVSDSENTSHKMVTRINEDESRTQLGSALNVSSRTYSAYFLASAIVQCAEQTEDQTFDAFEASVLKTYNELRQVSVVNRSDNVHIAPEDQEGYDFFEAQTEMVMNEAQSAIDLIHSMRQSDLSTEGLRATGQIPKDFNTLNAMQGEVVLTPEEQKLEFAKIVRHKDGYTLQCPYCGSESIFGESTDIYLCFSCNNRFYCDLSLGDIISNDDDDAELIQRLDQV